MEKQYLQLINKKVSIQQKSDDFWKYGLFVNETEDHIVLKFSSGSLHFIAKDNIKTMMEDDRK